jgi:hypothetical protein
MKQIDLPPLFTIIYINSRLLYEYLVKFNITKKKRLIIDIIAIRQSYKYQELFEIR